MMTLSERNAREVVRLLAEIDKEACGKFRPLRIINLTRRIRLVINKSSHGRNRKCSSPEHYGCSV